LAEGGEGLPKCLWQEVVTPSLWHAEIKMFSMNITNVLCSDSVCAGQDEYARVI
jgi:hypothetical protein